MATLTAATVRSALGNWRGNGQANSAQKGPIATTSGQPAATRHPAGPTSPADSASPAGSADPASSPRPAGSASPADPAGPADLAAPGPKVPARPERPGRSAADPAHRALADRLRLLVLDGRLPVHSRMPAERELAAALGISRTTVSSAYDRLRAAGILRSRRGAGSWTDLPTGAYGTAAEGLAAQRLAAWVPPAGGGDILDLAHAAPHAPPDVIQRAAMAASRRLPAHLATHGYDPYGLDELRTAVADRYTARGLPTQPAQIMITAGAQQAWVLLLRTLAAPGDRVLVEQPTYPAAIDAIRRAGARPVSVGFRADGGWDLDTLAAETAQSAPRLAYLIPDFHHPTGGCMNADQRADLIRIARRARMTLIIDETMAELGLDGPPPPPVGAGGGAVIHTGSMGKTFWGGLRIGWIRAAEPQISRLALVRATFDMASPVLEQLVSAELLTGITDYLPARLAWLRARRDQLLDRLATDFPTWTASCPPGGLSLWVDLGAPVSSALTLSAACHGLLLAAGPRFGADTANTSAFEHRLRLPYTLGSSDLDRALDRLAASRVAVGGVPADQPGIA